MVDLAAKKQLKIPVYISFKNWAIATRFIIVITYLNSLAKVFELLSLSCILVRIQTKKFQKSDRFNIIHIVNILLLIINTLINKFCSMHLVIKWEKWKATIYI